MVEHSTAIERIAEFLSRRGISATAGFWERLAGAYRTPPRHYHGLEHLCELCERYVEIEAGPGWQHPREVLLAIVFHDAVYVAGRTDNERCSAEMARDFITRFIDGGPPRSNGPEPLNERPGEPSNEPARDARPGEAFLGGDDDPLDIAFVTQLIRRTSGHGEQPATGLDPDTGHFLDADMAILAAPEERFAEYDQQIAREYSHLPAPIFRRGRRAFFERLLASEHIFHTPWFRERYEARARANLRRTLGPSSAPPAGS